MKIYIDKEGKQVGTSSVPRDNEKIEISDVEITRADCSRFERKTDRFLFAAGNV